MRKIAKTDKEEPDPQNKAALCQNDLLSNLDFLTESTYTPQTPERHNNGSARARSLQAAGHLTELKRVLWRTNDAPIQHSPPLKSVSDEVKQVSLATQPGKSQLDWLSAFVSCEFTLICLENSLESQQAVNSKGT